MILHRRVVSMAIRRASEEEEILLEMVKSSKLIVQDATYANPYVKHTDGKREQCPIYDNLKGRLDGILKKNNVINKEYILLIVQNSGDNRVVDHIQYSTINKWTPSYFGRMKERRLTHFAGQQESWNRIISSGPRVHTDHKSEAILVTLFGILNLSFFQQAEYAIPEKLEEYIRNDEYSDWIISKILNLDEDFFIHPDVDIDPEKSKEAIIEALVQIKEKFSEDRHYIVPFPFKKGNFRTAKVTIQNIDSQDRIFKIQADGNYFKSSSMDAPSVFNSPFFVIPFDPTKNTDRGGISSTAHRPVFLILKYYDNNIDQLYNEFMTIMIEFSKAYDARSVPKIRFRLMR
jgi:hypothetical protein